jgi:hypothetical protein
MERKNTEIEAQFSHQALYTLKLIFENAIFPELCVMFPTGMLRSIFFILFSKNLQCISGWCTSNKTKQTLRQKKRFAQ